MRLAIACVDVDRFKDINDTLGHHAGDQLICGLADRLREAVREDDFVARLGGDEFAILRNCRDDADGDALLADGARLLPHALPRSPAIWSRPMPRPASPSPSRAARSRT